MENNLAKTSAQNAIKELGIARGKGCLIDVRSEQEFTKGHFPGAVNIPILSDELRHLVGLTYKTKGPQTATQLGYELVEPQRSNIIRRWSQVIGIAKENKAFLYCWRGGQRSQIACQWIKDQGGQVVRVEGGFKALRKEVLAVLSRPYPVLMISGMTGAGKTRFLSKHFAYDFLDLEGLACHRGSAFGGQLKKPQPRPVVFEAELALKLMEPRKLWLVEDESRRIGRLQVPSALYDCMTSAAVVLLETSLEDRAKNIFNEYVVKELQSGWEAASIAEIYKDHLLKIQDGLGMKLYGELKLELQKAFATGAEQEAHLRWISPLLEQYYDRLYSYSLAKKGRKTLFKGNANEVQDWLKTDCDKLQGKLM